MQHVRTITRQVPARAQYEDVIGILSIVQVLISIPSALLQTFSDFLRVGGELQNFQKAPSPPPTF